MNKKRTANTRHTDRPRWIHHDECTDPDHRLPLFIGDREWGQAHFLKEYPITKKELIIFCPGDGQTILSQK